MSPNLFGECYVSGMASISGSPAMKDFTQEGFLDSPPPADSLLSVQSHSVSKDLTLPAIRTVIAGPASQDRKALQYFIESEAGTLLVAECTHTELEAIIRANNPDLVV